MVLDGVDGTFGSPVNGRGGVGLLDPGGGLGALLVDVTEHGFELSGGPVGELVVASGP